MLTYLLTAPVKVVRARSRAFRRHRRVLGEAREHNADLVVVGTRKRTWFDRLVAGSVAEQIVNRAKRSVLVTPLDDARPLTGAPLARA
ncbi:MAG: universal stress protein [Polyangiaceae bacterium]|nr:universal stress protein [Polyangiaceae bacterium]